MKNKAYKFMISCACVLTLMNQSIHFISASSRYYQITFAPGSLGEFKQTLIQDYQNLYGTKNVNLSKATGSVTIKVEAEKTMPNAPTAQDTILKDSLKQYYVLTSGWQPASTTVSENATYVVQYGALTNSVDYSIRYVDITTKQDIALPVFAKANSNEVMNAYAKSIDGYTFDTQTKSITLTSDVKQNVLTFYYTAGVETKVVNQVEENVVTRNQIVTIPNNNINTNIPLPNNETILNENETPLSNAGTNETIEDEKTPLSKGDELTKNNQILYYSLGGIAVLGILIGLFVILKKKKEHTA